jgi:hypothetical protein
LTGLNLKKFIITLFAVLLVFTMLQAKGSPVYIVVRTQQMHPATVCRFIPSSPIEKSGIVESSSEICPQTISQRSEFKKIFYFNFTTIFQVHTFHFAKLELILKSKSFPAVPLYISHCMILI